MLWQLSEKTKKTISVENSLRHRADKIRIRNFKVGSVVFWPPTPQWLLLQSDIDFYYVGLVGEKTLGDPVMAPIEYQREVWGSCLQIYTDGCRDLTTGKISFGVYFK